MLIFGRCFAHDSRLCSVEFEVVWMSGSRKGKKTRQIAYMVYLCTASQINERDPSTRQDTGFKPDPVFTTKPIFQRDVEIVC